MSKKRTASLFTLALIAFVLSLGAVIRASALPVEARTSETWYAYQHELNYNFRVAVKPGAIYPSGEMEAGALLQTQLPVEPTVHRRVVLSRLTDSIRLTFPYRFVADRPAEMTATYLVDGTFTVPNLWQRPYPLMAAKEVRVNGTELILDAFAVDIPIKGIVDELENLTREMKLNQEQAEIRLRPTVKVAVSGQRESVVAEFAPEILVHIKGINAMIEIDEPKVFRDQKSYSTTLIQPLTVNLLGFTISMDTLRTVALVALTIFTGLLGLVLVVQWLRRRTHVSDDLKRLGTALIVARGFELPADATIVDVGTVQQLIALHLQTDRPVIRVKETCYLLDGSTCYRLSLSSPEADSAAD